MASIAVNVTQQKRTEIALQQAKEAAESASKAKSNFLACMSHELRTPLISILGFSQLLREDFSLTVKQREHIQTIYRSGKHLLDLINNILSMYKIEAGKIELEENRLDLPKMLTSLQEMFKLKIKEKGLALVLECETGLPRFIISDEVKLRQVLINLLQNAIKFTNRGSVTLRVQLSQDLNNLYFEVEDTGIGIAPDLMSNLFTPFAQTLKNHKYSEGTGLGLAISRNYVRLMGSDIEVKSILGRGSVFSFKIPLKTQSQSYNGKSTLIQPNPKVLIVDHEDLNRKTLVKFLETLPLELKEAVDAQEAIYFSQLWKPDLILMDMEMPGMDGYQATHLIKNQKTEKYPFVIALCDYTSEENSLAIAGVGCEDFITKPFTRQVVIDKISDYLGLSVCESGISSRESVFNYNTLEFKPLTQEDLTVMPSSWVRQLHLAAREINDQQLLDLIQEIPDQETALINGLTDLVKNFRVDLILELTK